MSINSNNRINSPRLTQADLFKSENTSCRGFRKEIESFLTSQESDSLSRVNHAFHKLYRSNPLWHQKTRFSFLYSDPFYIQLSDQGNEKFDWKSRAKISYIPPVLYAEDVIPTYVKVMSLVQNVLVMSQFIYSFNEREGLEHLTFFFLTQIKYGIVFIIPVFPIAYTSDKIHSYINGPLRRIKYIKDTADVPDQTIPSCHLRVLKLGFRMINKASRILHKYASMFE